MSDLASAKYNKSVFINCPFEDECRFFFEAIVFAVIQCGFTPRCALEISDGGQVRIEKINDIIEDCRFGIHDICRTELDKAHGLPRFNMPLELGLFLGCQRFGGPPHTKKSCLIFDKDRFRYQKFISDIAGQDIKAHGDDPRQIIKGIRDWLRPHRQNLPGGEHFSELFDAFQAVLPDLCSEARLQRDDLHFVDLVQLIRTASASPSAPAAPKPRVRKP